MTVQELLILNHTHTDIGYTDHADTLFRHQNRIIDDALDLVEQNAHRDDASKFRWTCEVAWTTANWFRQASNGQKDRFRAFSDQGLVSVGAMPVHWTPLVSPAVALHSLKHLRLLHDEGIRPRVAIQCDVNGLGWFWTDMLLAAGVDSFLIAPNPHRGMAAKHMQRAFNWRSPSGQSLFTVHGWHYSVGVNVFFFGDNDPNRTQGRIDGVLGQLDEQYPYRTAIMPLTNQSAPDNGLAQRGTSDFVERWNAEGRTPRLRLATIDQAMDAVRTATAEHDTAVPEYSGDWPDSWVDGVGSTAYETVLARSAERLLPAIDLLAAFNAGGNDTLLERAADEIALYDEHTWGAYSSVSRPDSPFSRIQHNWKVSRAHNGFAFALEAAQNQGQARARAIADGPIEGDFRLRRADSMGRDMPSKAERPMPPQEQSYYVLNPTSVPRTVAWSIVPDHAGSAPQTILDAHLTDQFLPGMVTRNDTAVLSTHLIAVDLPPFGEAIVKPTAVTMEPLAPSAAGTIETTHYRLEVNSADGSIRSLRDKRTSRECVDPANPLGRIVYETLADPKQDRTAIFGGNYDWSRLDTLVWPKDPRFARHCAANVRIGDAVQTPLGIEISVDLAWPHGDTIRVVYRLPHNGQGVEMDTLTHKRPIETPEAFYVLFGTPGTDPRITFDIGDQVIDPESDQVPHSCQTWSAIQRFATVQTEGGALVVASPDAPLVQPFGIQTARAGYERAKDGATLAFWTLNNHWDTNFAASQSGRIPARFRLLPQEHADPAAAFAFAEAACTPPVIVRAYGSTPQAARPLLQVDGAEGVTVRVRQPWFGVGLILTLVNPGSAAYNPQLRFPAHALRTVEQVNALEQPIDGAVSTTDAGFTVPLAPGATAYLRVTLD